jgi:hypothetical protein
MAKTKIDWHSRPASDHQKDVTVERFNPKNVSIEPLFFRIRKILLNWRDIRAN